MHYIYILKCNDKTLYCGYTTDLKKREAEHNGKGKTETERSAGAKYTMSRRPVKMVYHESFSNRSEAMQREYVIKQLTRTSKLELIKAAKKHKK